MTTSRLWKSACLSIALLVASFQSILLSQQSTEILIQGNRDARDQGLEFPVKATPVNWDFEHGILTVRLADGVLREIEVNHLHTNDRRAIERAMRQTSANPRGSLQSSNATENRPNSQANNSGNHRRNNLSNSRRDNLLNNQLDHNQLNDLANQFNQTFNTPFFNLRNNPAMDMLLNSDPNQGNLRDSNSNPRALTEIDFHKDFSEAQLAAQGSGSPDDTRPIIWFRVLGELDGLM